MRGFARRIDRVHFAASSGQSTAEVVCAFIIFIPLVLVAIDLVCIYSAYSLNDRVCRDAARAAASGPPDALAPGSPKQRAVQVIREVYTEATVKKSNVLGTVHLHPDCIVKEQLFSLLPNNTLGGPVDGQVTVETTADSIPPFLVKQFIGPNGIPLSARETFPYTYVLPSTTQK